MPRTWSILGLSTLVLCAVACGQAPERAPAPAAAAAPKDDGLALANDDTSGDAACVGVEAPVDALPVDLFAVVDGSGSMHDATSTGVSKWFATKEAFSQFLQHAPSGMGFGLSLFPLEGGASSMCSSGSYRDAALPIADLRSSADQAMARLEARTPQGQTPTAPALTAALDLAATHALTHLDRSVVVVLATDGLPTTCAPTDTAALAALAKDALEGPAHVRTLVVASLALGDTASGRDMASFDRIAAAGGTGRALSIDPHGDFAGQLSGALSDAAARKVACDLALPEAPAGQHLDYDAVNVLIDGAERTTLPRVNGPTSCGTSGAGGWYYDLDPATGAPTRLNVCSASCAKATALRVELGCKTVVR